MVVDTDCGYFGYLLVSSVPIFLTSVSYSLCIANTWRSDTLIAVHLLFFFTNLLFFTVSPTESFIVTIYYNHCTLTEHTFREFSILRIYFFPSVI